jgi:hypothetical protein
MRLVPLSIAFAAGALIGALACGPPLVAQPASPAAPPARSPLGVPGGSHAPALGALVIDREDLRLGTTVQYPRVPDASEINDLVFVRGLVRMLLVLDQWPDDVGALQPLARLPEGVDLVVVLPGYPPSRAAAEAWNLAGVPARLVVVADGPPPTGAVTDLNALRALERVIVDTDAPSRAGFERLQRPLSFRLVRE